MLFTTVCSSNHTLRHLNRCQQMLLVHNERNTNIILRQWAEVLRQACCTHFLYSALSIGCPYFLFVSFLSRGCTYSSTISYAEFLYCSKKRVLSFLRPTFLLAGRCCIPGTRYQAYSSLLWKAGTGRTVRRRPRPLPSVDHNVGPPWST